MTDFKTPYGLIGRKLGHSISPEIHAALGNPHYSLYELEPDELPVFLADTRLKALNVTIPYKIDVIPLCKTLDPLAGLELTIDQRYHRGHYRVVQRLRCLR